ncbi:MAG TPA: ubiquinol-cytochrome c reductase iron-sulfur subunit [Verrucomicrobiae bacterium]|nr:ubiquinol-cytochrome c reductase iron-sulfur subunit [Verrucomicrobiae bacterium]
MNIPRRRFIKYVTFGTASSIVAGKLWQRDVQAFCVPTDPNVKEGMFKVRVSDYPALAQPFGSVRLGLNPVHSDDFPDGSFYPFLINRDDAGNFFVLDGECRHQGCVVATFDTGEMRIRCPCHGSTYDYDGSVWDGPTTQPLHSYPFEYDGNDTLIIRIPCWGFEVRAAVVSGGSSRLRLDFEAFQNATYEVKFREHLTAPWTTASFATTPDGPANETSVTTFAGKTSVYVDRTTTTGYYALAVKLSEV